MKKQVSLISSALLLIASVALSALGQTETAGGLSTADADRIVQTFTSKEVEFRRALNSYSFKRDALIQSIGMLKVSSICVQIRKTIRNSEKN